MHICIISGMYPTKKAPHGGVFITRRIEALMELGVKVSAYALVREESKLVERIRMIAHKPIKERFANKIKTDNPDIVYDAVHVKLGLFGLLLNLLSHEGYFAWKAGKKLSKSITNRYDIIHAHWLYPTGAAAIALGKKLNIPVFITCHGSDINRVMKSESRKGCIKTLEAADEIEFVSKKLRDTAADLGGKWKKAHVLPNGINEIPSVPTVDRRNIVGFVGNLIDVKRVECFPEVFKEIIKFVPDAEFLIIGSGDRMDWLKENLKEYPVSFTGRLSQIDVIERMKDMKLLILPSRNEGWPCVVLEAHSCGTPVIGSNAGGIPEAIGNKEFIVEDEDEKSFAIRFSRKAIDVLNGTIFYDSNDLRRRAESFTWKNLQNTERDYYLSHVKSKQ